jgi:hypothetical protein
MSASNSQAVTFKVSELIESANTIITQHDKAVVEYDKKIAAFLADHRKQWLAVREANIRKLRDYLTKCLRNKSVPTTQEVTEVLGTKHYSYNGADTRWQYEKPAVYDEQVKHPAGYYAKVDELAALVSLLESMEGKTVSVNQLRNMGFKSREIIDLFRNLADTKRAEARRKAEATNAGAVS